MPPLATGLGLGIFVVLIIISIMIQRSRRYNKLMNLSGDIIANAEQAQYICEIDDAISEINELFPRRNELQRNRVRMLLRRRERMVEWKATYAPYETIRDACRLLNVPDDSCDDDISRAAKALLDDLEPKALRKRKAPKGVFVTAKIRRAEIIRARDLLRKRPR